MTAPRNASAADPGGASHVAATEHLSPRQLTILVPTLLIARRTLAEYIRGGWILAELAYVLALYLFAFRYPFEASFFFETANWGLGLLTVCATLLLVARAMRPAIAQPAIARVTLRAYTAGLVLAAAALRIAMYVALLALALLSRHLINATGGALLAGSVGLIAGCIVLAALALALSPAFAPRPAPPIVSPDGKTFRSESSRLETVPRRRHLIFLAWLTGALYSYTTTGALAAILLVWRLPLLPLFAGYTMGMTGIIGWRGVLALVADAGYVVGLVLLASFWRKRRDATPAVATPAATEEARGAVDPAPTTAPEARAISIATKTTPSRAASRVSLTRRRRPSGQNRSAR